MRYQRLDEKLAEGLWKVCFITLRGKLCTWFLFVEEPRNKTILELSKVPRLGKGKTLKQVFEKMGIGYIPKTKRLKKKALKKGV